MSLSKLAPPSEKRRRIDEDEGGFFPLLRLPDDLIGHTFSFLLMKDRMRARVNKKLNRIELESKYFMEKLTIDEWSARELDEFKRGLPIDSRQDQHIIFKKTSRFSPDCIRRIVQNTTVEHLKITLWGWKYQREIFDLIKKFNLESLKIRVEIENNIKEIMTDRYLLDISKMCKSFEFLTSYTQKGSIINMNISPETLHQVYKNMMDGSTKIREVKMMINYFTSQLYHRFFDLIGITRRHGNQFVSNRPIEAFEETAVNNRQFTHIFDGNIEFIVVDSWDFCMKRHDSRDSLELPKNVYGFVKLSVTIM